MKEIRTHDELGRPVSIRVGDTIRTGITEPESVVHRVIGVSPDRITCQSCQGEKCWETEWTPEGFADCLTTPPVV